jgi:hypothetical protein
VSLEQEAFDDASPRMSEGELRLEVQRFANRYTSAVGSFFIERIEDAASPPEDRLAALRLAHGLANASLQISIGPHPVVNLLDMMVLTSLTRRRADARMEVAGFYLRRDLEAIAPTLAALEADIWALGARLLTEKQLESLRHLIDEWLRENPDQAYVVGVRFDTFASRHGENELAEVWELGLIPGLNLVPELDTASEAADEIRVLLERYLVYFQHLPSILRWESQQK